MESIGIEKLAIFASALGADGPFQRILERSQEVGMQEGEGFFYFPIPEDIVESYVPQAIRPDIELTFTMFIEDAPPHTHHTSDGVLFLKQVENQLPDDWEWWADGRWNSLTADHVIRIPCHQVHGLRRRGNSGLYAITANNPPLPEDDIVYA